MGERRGRGWLDIQPLQYLQAVSVRMRIAEDRRWKATELKPRAITADRRG